MRDSPAPNPAKPARLGLLPRERAAIAGGVAPPDHSKLELVRPLNGKAYWAPPHARRSPTGVVFGQEERLSNPRSGCL